ncbi:uncharacterized protein LOC121696076 [Alosa sapidissima]|uniref:uncharacterized protein LOC121696076 n=1 Tax=Alosa sapidissima TaxID=34773 RepID=UPI001C08DD93|nr:uncharacterized protein LOC121696076 [Alosa sapidissima]
MKNFETGCLYLLILLNLFTRGFAGVSHIVRRYSVPEDHFLFLCCDSDPDNPNMEWRNGAGQVIASKKGAAVSYLNQNKYHISDGFLQIKDLERADAGEYYCNGHLEAEVEVLTGQTFYISEGRTLLIPCESDKKQVWSFRKERSPRRVNIFTVFRNGTIIRMRDDPQGRFVPYHKALEIVRLELEDSGKYMCNSNVVARLTVIKAHKDQIHQTITAVTDTIVTDSPEITGPILNKVAVIAVVGLCVLVSSVFLVSLILCQRKMSKKRKNKKNVRITGTGYHHEETELQPQGLCIRGSPKIHSDVGQSLSAEQDHEVHYASLGRQNWLERGRMQDKGHQVIYSTVAVA